MNTKYVNCIKKICKDYSVEFDLVDIQEFDSSLDYYEFKEEVINFISNLVDTTTINANKLTREDLYQIEENRIMLISNKLNAQKQITKYNDHFYKLKKYVTMITKKHTNNLIISGVGGIGKSYTTIKTINANLPDPDCYVSLNGYMTPLKFYETLYNNRDKLIVLDDVSKLLTNDINVSTLKGAMWDMGTDNKRIVTYNSTSEKLLVPTTFEFTGQIIIILNKIDKAKDVHTKALLSRAVHYNMNFTLTQIKEILTEISDTIDYKTITTQQKQTVTKYIMDNVDETTDDLNIRSLVKAFDIFLFALDEHIDWKPLVLELFNKDDELVTLKEVLNEYSTRKDQVKAFMELTGKSRSSFFRLLKKL